VNERFLDPSGSNSDVSNVSSQECSNPTLFFHRHTTTSQRSACSSNVSHAKALCTFVSPNHFPDRSWPNLAACSARHPALLSPSHLHVTGTLEKVLSILYHLFCTYKRPLLGTTRFACLSPGFGVQCYEPRATFYDMVGCLLLLLLLRTPSRISLLSTALLLRYHLLAFTVHIVTFFGLYHREV
jgi:hypothetical protein